MRTVPVIPASLAALGAVLDEVSARRLETGAQRARALLRGRRVWNVSVSELGGVGELLRTLLPYVAGAEVDVRWLVVDGDRDFDAVVSRLHYTLHGHADPGPLGPEEMAHYERVLAANLAEVRGEIGRGDVVILHDPGPAGLAPALAARGAHVVWRCHVGTDAADGVTDRAWAFLEPSLAHAERVVFTRASYRPGFLDPEVVRVIQPSVDPLSPKNREMDDGEARRLLREAGILAGPGMTGDRGPASGAPASGLGAAAGRGALTAGEPLPADARVVVQLSRWDRLKDMTGLLIAFAESFEELPPDVHLLLAGAQVPATDVAGTAVLSRCLQIWQGLDAELRARTHIACLPTADSTANALLVNAVQRQATVVVQKSLAEGFGLTVAEALWKSRPVVATAVGGIQDQITDGENGLLVTDPRDLQGLMTRVQRLLAEPGYAAQLGAAAHARVRREYLSDRHLLQYVDLVAELL